jgi:hypothetical protein
MREDAVNKNGGSVSRTRRQMMQTECQSGADFAGPARMPVRPGPQTTMILPLSLQAPITPLRPAVRARPTQWCKNECVARQAFRAKAITGSSLAARRAGK